MTPANLSYIVSRILRCLFPKSCNLLDDRRGYMAIGQLSNIAQIRNSLGDLGLRKKLTVFQLREKNTSRSELDYSRNLIKYKK